MKRWLLSCVSAERLEAIGLWLIIAGLIGEAALVFSLVETSFEKLLTFLFTLAIAAGVWIENVGSADISSEKDARIAEANARTKEAELALARLEERFSRRKITQKDQQFIADKISAFKGQKGQIGCSPIEFESMRLEGGLHAALQMGGWEITRGVPTHMPMSGGISIASTAHPQSVAAAKQLCDALNAIGLLAMAAPFLAFDDPPTSTRVFVTIGPKPNDEDAEWIRMAQAAIAQAKG
jgi:hypothetical protein